jgi:hypothetical protein
MTNTFKELLIERSSCAAGSDWVDDKTVEQAVEQCKNGAWLIWLGKKFNIDLQILTLAKVRCVKTIFNLIADQKSIEALNIAEKFGLGEKTKEELDEALELAKSGTYNSQTSGQAHYAVIAAIDTTDSVEINPADNVANAYAAVDVKNPDLKNESLELTADICREIIGDLIINKVNEVLLEN